MLRRGEWAQREERVRKDRKEAKTAKKAERDRGKYRGIDASGKFREVGGFVLYWGKKGG